MNHEPLTKKLILFDIDGTLIHHVGKKTSWTDRYKLALQDVYGVPIAFDDPRSHDGSIERKVAWDELQKEGSVSYENMMKKFPEYLEKRIEYFEKHAKVEHPFYTMIAEASTLLLLLANYPDRFMLGLLTGNAKRIADWKMKKAACPYHFPFGLYGDEADDRNELAKLVFQKAKHELGWDPKPDDIVVIGDTVSDIRCGKAIGAKTIGVLTGLHTKEGMADVQPDLLVPTLMDEAVLSFFHVKYV